MIYPHQQDAIDWMYNQWQNKSPALLADSMGLGKTLDICILLERIQVQKALLVVPTSTIYQWVRNLLTHCPSYQVYVNTNHKIRRVYLSETGKIEHGEEEPIEILNDESNQQAVSYKVSVCNYHSITPFPSIHDNKIELQQCLDPALIPFKNIVWDIIVADEVHKLRNGINTNLDPNEARKKMLMFYRMSRLRMFHDESSTKHSLKIGLTGTPIQNRYSDVVSILTWLGCKFPPRITSDIVKSLLSRHMFRRTENDLHIALRSLISFPEMPPQENDIHVVYESQAEADVYRIVAGAIQGMTIQGGETNPYSKVQYEENALVRTTYLRLLSADINQFIISHNKRHKSVELPYWTGTTSKINMIADKIEELARENESVLVFVHFKEERDAIREKVWQKSPETFGYVERWIDGDVEPQDREYILFECRQIVENGGKCIIYATMQSSSDGLNIQFLCRIIISTTDWNPANELQAIKRAHRIGQKRLVVVYRYIHKFVDKYQHIDMRIEEKKSQKQMKSDELITNEFNAARLWPVRDMPGWNEPCVLFTPVVLRMNLPRSIVKVEPGLSKEDVRKKRLELFEKRNL